MDASPRTSSKRPPPTSHDATHVHPRALSYTSGDGSYRAAMAGRRPEGALRREHSDGGNFLADFEARPRPGLGQEGGRVGFHGGTTSGRGSPPRDFGQFPGNRSHIVTGRERMAQLMADRIDRMSRHQEDIQRRRTSSNPSHGYNADTYQHLGFTGPPNDRMVLGAPNHPANPLPPRDLNRPLPQRPTEEAPVQNRQSREAVLPRWQADAEVSECPICHATFSFWYRKHHCRKCGRVVCANCSPHRITIPRQFIVNSPEEAQATPGPISAGNTGPAILALTGDDRPSQRTPGDVERPRTADYRIDSALGGGQEVRLCNPCVPDPNTLPPPSYYTSNRMLNHSTLPGRFSGQPYPSSIEHMNSMEALRSHILQRASPGRPQHQPDQSLNLDPTARPFFPFTTSPVAPSTNFQDSPNAHSSFSPHERPSVYGSAPNAAAQERYLESLLQRQRSQPHSHRHHNSLGSATIPGHPRVGWSREMDPPPPRPVLQPQLREEDECPICHGALPPKGPDGGEEAREAHVEDCIATQFSGSAPRSSQPNQSRATDAALAASAATLSQASGTTQTGRSSEGSQHRRSLPLFQQRRRTTGMVVYHATEKDSVGENGEGEAECVICFEEFAVGDEMGRLECLCKFHRVCIRQWWDTKGPGVCPVHQQQEEA